MNENPNRSWAIQPEVDRFVFERFAECMADIAEHVRLINEMCVQGQLNTHSFINRGARDISVAIRKVMLDGNGYLFKECVEPLLHPLKDPKGRPRKGLSGDVLVERLGGMAIEYTEGESQEQRTFRAPAYEHRTVVNPLYGLRRVGKEQYQLDDLFDLSGQPLKFSRWNQTKVLQVEDAVLTSERILQLLVTYEGAHVKTNELIRNNASTPVDIKLPDHKDDTLFTSPSESARFSLAGNLPLSIYAIANASNRATIRFEREYEPQTNVYVNRRRDPYIEIVAISFDLYESEAEAAAFVKAFELTPHECLPFLVDDITGHGLDMYWGGGGFVLRECHEIGSSYRRCGRIPRPNLFVRIHIRPRLSPHLLSLSWPHGRLSPSVW